LASNGIMMPQTQPITGGSKAMIDRRDGVSDDDAFGSDEDFFNHAAQYFLAVLDGGSAGGLEQPSEEPFEVRSVGQGSVGSRWVVALRIRQL